MQQQTWWLGHFAVACRTHSVPPPLLATTVAQGSPRKIAPNEKSQRRAAVSHSVRPTSAFPAFSSASCLLSSAHPLASEVLTFLLCSARCGKVIFIHIHSFTSDLQHIFISPPLVLLFFWAKSVNGFEFLS